MLNDILAREERNKVLDEAINAIGQTVSVLKLSNYKINGHAAAVFSLESTIKKLTALKE